MGLAMSSSPNSRKIWTGLIIASCLLVLGLTIYVMYQVVACYVVAFGSKGEQYDKGVELLDKGKYADALAKAELSIRAHENTVESNLLRANALYALGRPGEARADLKLVAKVKPQLAYDLHHQAYQLIQDEGAPTDVVRLESIAIEILPNIPKFYVNRAYSYSDLDLNQKAIDDCTLALAIKPIEPDVIDSLLLNRANAYSGAHLYKEALHDCQVALSAKTLSEDDRWRLLNAKVDALIGLKNYKEALAVCDQGLELVSDDKDWMVTFKELKIDALKGRNDKALKDAEQIVKLKDECKRLNASIDADEKAEADKIRDESGGN
ncbi:hypothetical protein BH11CYA1_BH11CYA1_00620 [soil metagenome]